LEAVPAQYHDTIAMLTCRWNEELWGRGDPHAAAAVVDAHRPADPFDDVWTEFSRVVVDVGLVMSEPDSDVVAAAQRRAATCVESARRRGDVLTVGQGLYSYAYSLTYGGSLGDAVAAAMESLSIGQALGAGWIAATGSVSLTVALAAMAVSGAGDRATAAREIRRVITEHYERHNMGSVFGALDPLALLFWDYDAPTAYLLRLAGRRMWATGSPPPASAADVLDPATIAELEERANAMDANEVVAFALDALDRYLTAIDPR
jgi:hypothetical protein